jgi:serine/threonine protein kinase/Tol biopolymer transport system component
MTDFTGQDFDRYHILEALGEGGMASVYKAFDTRLERDVAVKIIRTDMFVPAALQQVLKRFEREAKSLAKLSHPNIVSIIDYGEHDGVPYLVMEYLPGGTLKDRLKGQPLAWQESFHMLLPVARALQFAHQQGIIHRDVKPSNILITLSGEPMLSDFGIAKILESQGSTSLTGTGVGMGTPEYMAPEQWLGKTSARSDLYSLGVVLYEMVTGRKPYTADTPPAILLKQANDPLPRPRQFVPDLPDQVEKIIFKVLAKKPEDRYSSMEEFSTALETLLIVHAKIESPDLPAEKLKVEELPPPISEPLPEYKQEEDQPTLISQAPVEEMEQLDALARKKSADELKTKLQAEERLQPEIEDKARQATQEKELIRRESQDQEQRSVEEQARDITRLEPEIEIPLSVEQHGKARQLISQIKDKVTKARALSDRLLKRLQATKFSGWMWAAGGLVIAGIILGVVLLVRGNQASRVSSLNSGGYMYFTSNESGKAEVYYMDPSGKKVQYTHTKGNYESWSPAPAVGGYVYFTSNESGKAEVYYMDPSGKKIQYTRTKGNYESWSPVPASGGYVYFTSNESGKAEVYYMDPSGKKVQYTHTKGNYESWSPVPASNGYVYFTSNESGKAEVYYMDPSGKKVQYTHTKGNYESWSPVPASNGYVYFTSNESGKAEVYYMDSSGKKIQFTNTKSYESWSPVSASNGYVYFTSNASGKAEVYYMDPSGKKIQYTHTRDKYESWISLSIRNLGTSMP